MADFELVTCNMIVKANGMMLGIYDLPRHMKKIAYMVGGEQHVISDIHMHGDKNATVFLVPGAIEIENVKRDQDGNYLPFVDIYDVPSNT